MTNTPQQFNDQAHSMAETAVIIHECLLDMPEGNANLEFKKYVNKMGICEGRARIVDFAIKLEEIWSSFSEEQGIARMQAFDCFDLGYVPRVIEWAENLKGNSVFWWDIEIERIKGFTLFPTDQ